MEPILIGAAIELTKEKLIALGGAAAAGVLSYLNGKRLEKKGYEAGKADGAAEVTSLKGTISTLESKIEQLVKANENKETPAEDGKKK